MHAYSQLATVMTTMAIEHSIIGAGGSFGPELSLQNKINAMKAKMKELMLAHNNQIIS
jgi:hypothetical protein